MTSIITLWVSIDYITLREANIQTDMMKPHEPQEQTHYNHKIYRTDSKPTDVL